MERERAHNAERGFFWSSLNMSSIASCDNKEHVSAVTSLTVMFYVQSCRGVGHLHRISAIAAAMLDRNAASMESPSHVRLRVVLVSGGPPAKDVENRLKLRAEEVASRCSGARPGSRVDAAELFRFVQLPAVRSATGSESWKLVDSFTGKPLSKSLEHNRRCLLLSVLQDEAPVSALVIEMFPFGRRRFHFEIEPLLDACYESGEYNPNPRLRCRPAIVCSVRDVLVSRSNKDYRWAAEKILSHFDAVLVHGQKSVLPFSQTFPLSDQIRDKIKYTGYVVDVRNTLNGPLEARQAAFSPSSTPQAAATATAVAGGGGVTPTPASSSGRPLVVVSAGGGGSGHVEAFYNAAILAAQLLENFDFVIRIGSHVKDSLFRLLSDKARVMNERQGRKWVSVEANRDDDFFTLLCRADVSVSQGGYNTVLETVLASAREHADSTGNCGRLRKKIPRLNILIPISPGVGGKDIEQELRASCFHQAGLFVHAVIPEKEITGKRLADAISGFERSAQERSVIKPNLAPIQGPNALFEGASCSVDEIFAIAERVRMLQKSLGSTAEHLHGARKQGVLPISEVCSRIPRQITPTSAYGGSSTATNPAVTVLLLNYKRPENVKRILDDLSRQKPCSPNIFLWNNSGRAFTDPRINWQIDSSENRFCWPRWMMGSLAQTKYICTMDDDFTFSDPFVLRDLVQHFERQEEKSINSKSQTMESRMCQVVGFAGCIFHPEPSRTYEEGFHVNANKFAWSAASKLPWQERIVYADLGVSKSADGHEGEMTEATPQSRQRINESEQRLKSKPWHSIPRWIYEAMSKDPETDASTSSSSSSSSSSYVDSTPKGNPSKRHKRRKLNGINSREDASSTASSLREKNTRVAEAVDVDIVKGRLMFLRADALRSVQFAFTHEDIRGDDIAICGMLAKGLKGQHRVLRCLDGRIRELPAPFALCNTALPGGSSHYSRRESVRRRFFPEDITM